MPHTSATTSHTSPKSLIYATCVGTEQKLSDDLAFLCSLPLPRTIFSCCDFCCESGPATRGTGTNCSQSPSLSEASELGMSAPDLCFAARARTSPLGKACFNFWGTYVASTLLVHCDVVSAEDEPARVEFLKWTTPTQSDAVL